jgi:hypothetical protein
MDFSEAYYLLISPIFDFLIAIGDPIKPKSSGKQSEKRGIAAQRNN